jgi:hypothetical protein
MTSARIGIVARSAANKASAATIIAALAPATPARGSPRLVMSMI